MYSIDGASGNWSDLNTVWTNSNFCIKAFTKTSDEEGPTITFGTNGDMEGKPEHSTTINVSDDSGINKNTLKYIKNIQNKPNHITTIIKSRPKHKQTKTKYKT